MESRLSIGRHPGSRDLETQSHQNSPSNSDLGLLSPSLNEQPNNDDEPLIRPTLPPHPSTTTFSTGSAFLSRKPVLPPRPPSISSINKQPEYVELQQLTPGEPDPRDPFKDKPTSIAPKAFRKPRRYLGLDLGYWRQPARHFSIFAILAFVIIVPLYFLGWGFNSLQGDFPPPFSHDCYSLSGGGWSFVGINLRFGNFNYGSAKALDLAWNWIVGRGLQALLMLLAYRVFNDALLRAAELTPLPFDLYVRLSLYTTRIDVLWYVLKALFRKGNWRTKAIFVWLFISIIYVVTFPSLMDACSGYEASELSFFQWPNSTSESTENFQDINWWGATSNATTVTSIYTTVAVCATYYLHLDNNTAPAVNFTYTLPNMTAVEAINQGFNDMSIGRYCNMLNEGQPSIQGNMEYVYETMALYYWQDIDLNKTWWDRFRESPTTSDPYDWASWGFYPTDADNFRCVSESGVYQWGFSYEWLFVVAVVNSCWLLGLWILWLDCDTNSELCKKGRRLGLWRAIADISEAMREELGPNICAYSESELEEALRNRPPVRYYVKHGSDEEPGHIGLSTKSTGRLRLRWDQEYGAPDGIWKRQRGALRNDVEDWTV
ncbi:hypothetical protein N431DRAFT_383412 [Stipitochalara longipes BDJ]|nr:hypothetical protein N431DRAFT_383412 [Stipitochalara longipes BDJ]